MGVKVNESPDNPFLIAGYALWIAFRFCIFVLWTQSPPIIAAIAIVVNCFQILYIRSLNTMTRLKARFSASCELLSDFVYSFFEHNRGHRQQGGNSVVNCFQILYIRSLNTISNLISVVVILLWIAFRFCIFVLWTQSFINWPFTEDCCELLSDFVYSFFEHNNPKNCLIFAIVVNWDRKSVV